MPKQPAFVLVGDIHANSIHALMPPSFMLDSGNIILYNKYQQWLWDKWQSFWFTVYNQYEVEAILLNGDLVQGIHVNRDGEIILLKKNEQHRLALAVLEPMLYDKGERRQMPLFVTRGTGYHDGIMGQDGEALAREMKAVQDPHTHSYSKYRWKIQWRGKILKATHHIQTANVYPLTPLFRALNEEKQRAVDRKTRMPDAIIRSHVHQCNVVEDSAGHLAMVLPAWQLSTEYVHKKIPEAIAPVGGMVLTIDEAGKLRAEKYLYSVPEDEAVPVSVSPTC